MLITSVIGSRFLILMPKVGVTRKLLPLYKPPAQIVKMLSNLTYKVHYTNSKEKHCYKVINVPNMKPCLLDWECREVTDSCGGTSETPSTSVQDVGSVLVFPNIFPIILIQN